jgi:hypothetical protein
MQPAGKSCSKEHEFVESALADYEGIDGINNEAGYI